MATHVMIDLETMGVQPGAAIVALGAVAFSAEGGILDTFYNTIDLASAIHAGGQIDASTVVWWMAQGDEARKELTKKSPPLQQVLQEFAIWLGGKSPVAGIWGNGAGFDNVILRQTYRRAKLKEPWHFAMDRCFRTMAAVFPDAKRVKPALAHNALEDARAQALTLIEIMYGDKMKGLQ